MAGSSPLSITTGTTPGCSGSTNSMGRHPHTARSCPRCYRRRPCFVGGRPRLNRKANRGRHPHTARRGPRCYSAASSVDLPTPRPEHDGGFPPSRRLALEPDDGYLVGPAFRPRRQIVGAGDHLPRQVEAILSTHPFGEQLDHPGQANSGLSDLAPQLEVAATAHPTRVAHGWKWRGCSGRTRDMRRPRRVQAKVNSRGRDLRRIGEDVPAHLSTA